MRIYEIDIDLFDSITGVDFNALVECPAHQKKFLAFNKENPKQHLFVDEEKKIVKGVMISADQKIVRYDEQGKFFVYFTSKTIGDIIQKFFKGKNTSNVNLEHNPNKTTSEVYMIESFQVDGVTKMPDESIGSKVGDWVASYKIENPKIWNDIKSGKFNGFSVEGFFGHIEKKLKVKTNKTKTKMSEKNKTFGELLNSFKQVFAKEEVFADVTTDTGLVLSYEGTLEVGTAITVADAETGEQTSAPEGVYALTGDMEGMSLVVGADGTVSEIIEAESGEDAVEVAEAVAEVMSAMVEMKKSVAELALQVQNFANQPAEEPKKKVKLTQAQKVAELRLKALKEKIGG